MPLPKVRATLGAQVNGPSSTARVNGPTAPVRHRQLNGRKSWWRNSA
jgi:hypothetical protein